ncbi:MAG: DUF3299 domain-containing protein [Betaproteobacteria bacterium]|nr:DUF3299 domain-containing protein [Betaproteobacteria bacterium]
MKAWWIVGLLVLAPLGVAAQAPQPGRAPAPAGASQPPAGASQPPAGASRAPPGAHQAPSGLPAFKPLPQMPGTLSWKTLAEVDLVKEAGRFRPKFSAAVAALNGKPVKLQGFMVPLESTERHGHFLLSALPQTCSFCLPGGPEAMVEVKISNPVKFTFEPLLVSGRLAVLTDDKTGMYYRIGDGRAVER